MKRASNAFTLVETIVAIVILVVTVGAVAMIMTQGYEQLAYAGQAQRAAALASVYLDEAIASGRWDELSGGFSSRPRAVPLDRASIGPEESNRAAYDDCDDYDGFTASAPHRTKNGEPLGDEYNLFTASIRVEFANADGSPASGRTNLKKITVVVEWNPAQRVQFSSLLANL